jgi:hypothetical protein
MNFPTGNPEKEGLIVKNENWRKNLTELANNSFTGYIVTTIQGPEEMEEGVLAFSKGKAVACYYEYMQKATEISGEPAIKHFFNSLNAEHGIAEIYALTKQQVELITSFNETIKLPKEYSKLEWERFFSSEFSSKLSDTTIFEKKPKEESPMDILKRIGLGKLSK